MQTFRPTTSPFPAFARLAAVCLLAAAGAVGIGVAATTEPAFGVDCAHPTADKPQSKLWHAAGNWWALLPNARGPSLWRRDASGWSECASVGRVLEGLPGRCDVWPDAAGVTAVGCAGDTIAVLRLRRDTEAPEGWRAERLASWKAPSLAPVETVTIARDGAGSWWVAAPVTVDGAPVSPKAGGKALRPRRVLVWHSNDARTWTAQPALAEGIGGDDLCLVCTVAGGVGVAWSDQHRDEVGFRLHRDGRAPADWDPTEIVAAGGRTADDHLHAAQAGGRLWLATKNSVDTTGLPQLVLRMREADRGWRNFPHGIKTAEATPSRPIITPTHDGRRLLLCQTNYDGTGAKRDTISGGVILVEAPAAEPSMTLLIAPSPGLKARLNDATGPKHAYPAEGPWLVLASDAQGRVYEADLRLLVPTSSGNE